MIAKDKKKMTILIIDDHKVVRDGIRFILSDLNDYAFRIHEAEDVHSALYFGTTFSYDVILMDINIKRDNGVDVTKEILSKRPDQNILAFTIKGEEESIKAMMDAGAKGYLLKDSGAEEIVKAMETIASGQKYFSNEVALIMLGLAETKANDKKPLDTQLSKREKEVLELISIGYTNAEIAEKLFLSKNTIDDYRKRMIKKFGIKNTAELIRFAMENKLIE